ncbi:hypothetical protein HK096_007518 [Nowakowskiella sp. JEL0078]|nr:hypothetical protein HK096_007518 [Nowakowskiella sp. JEL0078]
MRCAMKLPILVLFVSQILSSVLAQGANNPLPPKGTGTQFITGKCATDNDCASGCCDSVKKVCRAPLALSPGVEFCINGFTPNFNGGNAGSNIKTTTTTAVKAKTTTRRGRKSKTTTVAPSANTPAAGTGKQFITGKCSVDGDCASGCCEPVKGTCRAPLSLKPGVEFCGNGFSPNFNGNANTNTGSTNTGSSNTAPAAGTGKQFITGKCSADSDCASGCCEPKKGTCRAPLSLKPGVEFCGNGFTPNFGK